MTPHRTDRRSAFARNLIAGAGIVPCRDAPTYVADRRSLVAGVAIYLAAGIVLGVLVIVALAAGGK